MAAEDQQSNPAGIRIKIDEEAQRRWIVRGLQAGKVFTPTAPIDERSLFAGRDAQVRKIIDVINQKGQHGILFGERGVGKTSLANVLSSFLGDLGEDVIAPRVNCDVLDTFNSVWRKVFEHIELAKPDRSMRFRDTDGGDLIEYNAHDMLQQIDRTGSITPDAIRKTLTILSRASVPILIIDEFDRLNGEVRRVFADTIKSLSDHAIPATVVLVGVADSVDQLINEHQSIARALREVAMPPMSVDEIHTIINRGLQTLDMTIDEHALDTVAILAQGLPHYAHLIGLHASRAAIDERALHITYGHVQEAIRRALEGSQQYVRTSWHKATRSPQKGNLFADVLLACALAPKDGLGEFAAQDVREPMSMITGKRYEIPSFAQHLNEFSDVKRGPVLKKSGGTRRHRFKFIDPLLKPYVIMQGFAVGKLSEDVLQALGSR